ncbi:hypothetical protein [Vibrio taketomensis]|uniref:hypothetical protein n=1 Tax=Vibrio taketomensis TaxID=2572923 RepID=UPI0018D80895|nr:hypothetical protein [Vibrio taketomensis]
MVVWAWATFKEYDFEANPLQFSKEIIPSLKANAQALSGVQYADAIGVDFHKVGWSPYASSCFVYKDSEEFETLLKRPALRIYNHAHHIIHWITPSKCLSCGNGLISGLGNQNTSVTKASKRFLVVF